VPPLRNTTIKEKPTLLPHKTGNITKNPKQNIAVAFRQQTDPRQHIENQTIEVDDRDNAYTPTPSDVQQQKALR